MRVLFTDGTGLLGRGFVNSVSGNHTVVSIHVREYPILQKGAITRRCSILDLKALTDLQREFQFEAIVHAAGIEDVDNVERNVDESRYVNIEGTRNILSFARQFGVYLVYVSTNAVYDGTNPPYSENDSPHPIHEYGR